MGLGYGLLLSEVFMSVSWNVCSSSSQARLGEDGLEVMKLWASRKVCSNTLNVRAGWALACAKIVWKTSETAVYVVVAGIIARLPTTSVNASTGIGPYSRRLRCPPLIVDMTLGQPNALLAYALPRR